MPTLAPDGSQLITPVSIPIHPVQLADTNSIGIGSYSVGPYEGGNQFIQAIQPDAGNTPIGWGGPFTATSASTLFTLDTTGFGCISVQITTSSGTATVTYEQSNDGQTWVACIGYQQQNNGGTAITTTTTGMWNFPCVARYFRARISSYTSGTVIAYYTLRNQLGYQLTPIIQSGQGVSVTIQPTTVGQLSYTHIAGGAQANTVVKNSAGTLYSIVINSAPVSGSVMSIFDNTVASGTTIGIFTAVASEIPPYTMNYGTFGIAFATGLSINVATQNGGDMTVCYK